MKAKGQMGEANVATSNKNFHRGSTSGLKSRAYSSDSKKWKKNKGGKGNKVVPPTTAKRARKSRLQREPHCKYLAKKKKTKEGKSDLLVLETYFVENEDSAWIIDLEAKNHVCSSLHVI